MRDDLAADAEKLVDDYGALVEGVRMIRRAVERAYRAGILPPIEQIGMSPREECEAIARIIYRAAFKRDGRGGAAPLAGLEPNDFSN